MFVTFVDFQFFDAYKSVAYKRLFLQNQKVIFLVLQYVGFQTDFVFINERHNNLSSHYDEQTITVATINTQGLKSNADYILDDIINTTASYSSSITKDKNSTTFDQYKSFIWTAFRESTY